ncbi:MAG: Rab family GTPase [Promethearchaeia archaeon]
MSISGIDFKFKITVIGNWRVGKTSLLKRFTKSTFNTEYIKTIGAQLSKYDEEIEGDNIRLLFWDIAGQDDFGFLRPSFYRDSGAAIIVYSLEENKLGKSSFNSIIDWHDDILRFCGSIPMVLFANKIDLVDENNLDHTIIQKLVDQRNFLGYFITSAKTGQGVFKAFNTLIKDLYNKALSLELAG